MHVWYVDAGIEDTPEPVYTHCLVLSCLVLLGHRVSSGDMGTNGQAVDGRCDARVAVYTSHAPICAADEIAFLTATMSWTTAGRHTMPGTFIFS